MRLKIKKIKFSKARLLILCIILFLCTILSINTFSKYNSSSSSNANIQTALYLLNEDYKSMNMSLDSLLPGATPYVYNFSISNNDGTNRTDTKLEYDLKIKTTTNLPLDYKLYINGGNTNIISSDVISQDSDGTYFRVMTTDEKNFGFASNETNVYKLVVSFDSKYNNITYQNIMESIEIDVSSKQII